MVAVKANDRWGHRRWPHLCSVALPLEGGGQRCDHLEDSQCPLSSGAQDSHKVACLGDETSKCGSEEVRRRMRACVCVSGMATANPRVSGGLGRNRIGERVLVPHVLCTQCKTSPQQPNLPHARRTAPEVGDAVQSAVAGCLAASVRGPTP